MARMGWRLSAYALMGNHYPLRFKTPKAPLVEDMIDPSQSEQQACSIDAMINGGECEACQ
ncbi:MAG: hypothetical protein HKP15_11920 [Akkermansiaceae bacterium]|nr:hypothetical protein [Akkermansiaceae bacterium]